MSNSPNKQQTYTIEKNQINWPDAETKTQQFIKQKYPKLQNCAIRKIYREGNSWIITGIVEYKQAYILSVTKAFTAQVNIDTGNITAYTVTPKPANMQ